MSFLPWLIMCFVIVLYVRAIQVLIEDARTGVSLSMGGEGYFASLWLTASVLLIVSLLMFGVLPVWLPVVLGAVVFLLSYPVCRFIKCRYLGLDVEIKCNRHRGFSAFNEVARQLEKENSRVRCDERAGRQFESFGKRNNGGDA